MSERSPDPSLTALEAALASLAPQPARLNRDRLLFEAGRRAARPSRLWPVSAVTLACVALAQAGILLLRPAPAVVERYVLLPSRPEPAPAVKPVAPAEQPAPPAVASAKRDEAWPAGDSSWSLRDQVLRWGVDIIPDPPPVAPVSPREPAGSSTSASEGPRFFRLDSFLNLGGRS